MQAPDAMRAMHWQQVRMHQRILKGSGTNQMPVWIVVDGELIVDDQGVSVPIGTTPPQLEAAVMNNRSVQLRLRGRAPIGEMASSDGFAWHYSIYTVPSGR